MKIGSESGFSLMETIVAVTLLGIVALAFYQTYNESQRHLVRGQAVMDMQQNTRIALETIAAELRSAQTIHSLQSDRITFVSDLFTPGQTRDIRLDTEDVDQDGNRSELLLTREPMDDGTPGTQTDEIASSIGSVQLRYLTSLDGTVEAQSVDQIRRVEITVTGMLSESYGDSTRISFLTTVRPRNLRLPDPPDPDAEAPAAPTGVELTPSCGVLDITWEANTEDDLGGYRVSYKTGASGAPYDGMGAIQGSSPIYVATETFLQLTGLDPSEAYYVVVTAVDVSGNESGYSIERVAVPYDNAPPPVPTGVAVEVGADDALVVAWDESPSSDIAFYRVYYDSDESGAPYAWWDSTRIIPARLENLSTGTTYYIVVTASDACGNESGFSSEVTGVPTPCSEDHTPPAVPQGISGIAGDSKATLRWQANSEPDLHTYRLLYASVHSVDSVEVGLGTNYTLEGLTNEVDYAFSVVALDACGNRSGESAPVTLRPVSCAGDEVAPLPPAAVAVEDARAPTGDQLLLSWAPSLEADLAGYLVYCGGAPRSYADPIDVGDVVTLVLGDLVPWERYYVAVAAYDRCGNCSGFSIEATGVPTFGCECNPNVAFVTPADGAIVEDIVALVGTVSPCAEQSIIRLEFLVNDFPERAWIEPPFEHPWDTRRWPDGFYTLVLQATDDMGCQGQDTIHVQINNTGAGPGCVRVDITEPVWVSGMFDEEINFGLVNTSAVETCELVSLKTWWTTQNPEMSVARLHRIEIPRGMEVWDAGLEVGAAVTSGEEVLLTSTVSITGGSGEDVRLFFWHQDGDMNPGGRMNMPMGQVLVSTQGVVQPSRLCPADSFYTGCLINVANLTVSTGRTYQTAYITVGDHYYIDRNYYVQGIPSQFEDLLWIMTANGDKFEGAGYALEFDVDRRVILYVAYDSRDVPPHWITSEYTPVGLSIDVSDVGADVLDLWAREFPAGHITLYGNREAGAGSGVKTNYVVLLDCR
ncbi:MAG: prepilin-type N-terminal cleavage/methylation domain-containing protein [Candidatus Eisenbacteria sp.]|nr:prepilin-type N-terminal cleavage/methylation domain-containing protein [Candidatus Eisenbacteria bacterium]